LEASLVSPGMLEAISALFPSVAHSAARLFSLDGWRRFDDSKPFLLAHSHRNSSKSSHCKISPSINQHERQSSLLRSDLSEEIFHLKNFFPSLDNKERRNEKAFKEAKKLEINSRRRKEKLSIGKNTLIGISTSLFSHYSQITFHYFSTLLLFFASVCSVMRS
jgi:hypothetical protein